MKHFLSSILLFCTFTALAQFPQQVEEQAEAYVRKGRNPGLAVALVVDGQVKYKGFGRISRQEARPPGENTIFELGALTSVFTTTLMAEESIEGRFDMSSPIDPYLPHGADAPAFQPQRCVEVTLPTNPSRNPERILSCTPDPLGEKVCIAFCDLATHTSGLPNSGLGLYDWHPIGTAAFLQGPREGFTKRDFYFKVAEYPLKTQPGSSFHYSNIGIALAGHLLSDMNGISYEELLVKRLLGPLRMEDTRIHLSDGQKERLAQGHDAKGRPAPLWDFDGLAPAAGLRSTAKDLAVFLLANLKEDGSRLSAAMEQAQQARVDVEFPGLLRPTEAGYGWLISKLTPQSNQPVTWMYGGTAGFRSFLGFIKDAGIGVVLLSNSASDIRELGFEMLEELYREQRGRPTH
ncbi:MAG: beta-lactamase family protein [Phaeodactylibacter sp.]|nr:beta-lactamase family protein [Phaeodactylibacter sp.]MCB9265178.1 beta-lactamase family protein [Lewinellaceae bacterium]MCB9285960.1 beta-lactamase family protein [Lewinellaceae bacterium]